MLKLHFHDYFVRYHINVMGEKLSVQTPDSRTKL